MKSLLSILSSVIFFLAIYAMYRGSYLILQLEVWGPYDWVVLGACGVFTGVAIQGLLKGENEERKEERA